MDEKYTRANIFFNELKKEDDLRSIIKTPSAFKSYGSISLYFSIATIASLLFAHYYEFLLQSSRWKTIIVFVAAIAFFNLIWLSNKVIGLEERINALVQLMDIEKTPYKCAENEKHSAEKQ